MKIHNTRDYLNPDNFRFVGMVYAMPGTGKTSWVGTCDPKITGIAACETGLGSGLLSIANQGFDHIIPENMSDLEKFCKGEVFPDKKILVLDSLSAMARTFIKDAVISMPRARGQTEKRSAGVLELDDFGTLAGFTSKLLNLLMTRNKDKHIIVTATEKYNKVDENDAPGTDSMFGPNLAGQMFLEAPALFDFVLRLRTRSLLRDPKDAKSRYNQRYFMTDKEQGTLAKCRSNDGRGKPLLDKEEIFDLETGQGSFDYLVNKIVSRYKAMQKNEVAVVA